MHALQEMKKIWFTLIYCLFDLQSFSQKGDTGKYLLPYDKVVIAVTHNAFNYRPKFLFANQSRSIERQLNDGVRGFMLDIYMHKERVEMYHTYRFLGHTKLSKELKVIKKFLDRNPTEIITLFFENYVPFDELEKAFHQTGLLDYAYAQPLGERWPTLKEMAQKGKRLVVFSSERDLVPDNWCHFVYDYVTETSYYNLKTGDFNFRSDRGNNKNSLFLMNHFLYRFRAIASPFKSKKVNSFDFLFGRCVRSIFEKGKIPNFIAVDFYHKGDVIRVADSVNVLIVKGVFDKDLK